MWTMIKNFFSRRRPAYKKFAKNSYEVWYCKEYNR